MPLRTVFGPIREKRGISQKRTSLLRDSLQPSINSDKLSDIFATPSSQRSIPGNGLRVQVAMTHRGARREKHVAGSPEPWYQCTPVMCRFGQEQHFHDPGIQYEPPRLIGLNEHEHRPATDPATSRGTWHRSVCHFAQSQNSRVHRPAFFLPWCARPAQKDLRKGFL